MHTTHTLRKVARTPALPPQLQTLPTAVTVPPEPPLRVTPDDEALEKLRATSAEAEEETAPGT